MQLQNQMRVDYYTCPGHIVNCQPLHSTSVTELLLGARRCLKHWGHSEHPDVLPDQDSATYRDGQMCDYQGEKSLNVTQSHLAQVNSNGPFWKPGGSCLQGADYKLARRGGNRERHCLGQCGRW